MIRYSCWSPPESVDEVESHVRAHVSSVASAGDDPQVYADVVTIQRIPDTNLWGEDGVLVLGVLDADPIARYLMPGWDPEDDVAANPLMVASISGEDR
jgi:hypothetical protein